MGRFKTTLERCRQAVGSATAKSLTFALSICAYCNNSGTQPYDDAWARLHTFLRVHWPEIRRRRRFDLSKPFPGKTKAEALRVHLFFVKLFGCKVLEDGIAIDLEPFAKALTECQPHPEVAILIADSTDRAQLALAYDSDVYLIRNQAEVLHGAAWIYKIHPIAIKVAYIKAGAPLRVPGYRCHPNAPGKIVKLSPYRGATEPVAGRGALIPMTAS